MRLICRRLPPSWRIVVSNTNSALTLRSPDGSSARFKMVFRKSLDPRDVLAMMKTSKQGGIGTLVIAPFLSFRTRQLLREARASYADATGNIRLVLDKPGLYVETEGASKEPDRQKRPLESLKGPAAGRVVRALCDVGPPYGVRRLSQIAQTSPASVSRVINLLEREALIERGEQDQISAVDWKNLLQRWTRDYQVLSSNEPANFLAPRGVNELLERLGTLKRRIVVTGSLAATRRAPITPARIAMAYVDDPAAVAQSLDLRPAETGANVMLLRPFDPVVFARTWSEGGVSYAALSQVAADLLTSPGRGPSEGEELVAWMKKNVDDWRT